MWGTSSREAVPEVEWWLVPSSISSLSGYFGKVTADLTFPCSLQRALSLSWKGKKWEAFLKPQAEVLCGLPKAAAAVASI